MISSKKIKSIRYFENSSHIFPSVDVRGGVCFINWDLNFNRKTKLISGNNNREVQINKYDIIIPHIKAYGIIDKIHTHHKNKDFLSKIVWSRNPFGIESNYFKNKTKTKRSSKDSVECFSVGKNIYKISKTEIIKNKDKVGEYQVVFPKASGGGRGHRDKILLRPEHFFILKNGQISTETYSVAGSFKSLKEAKFLLNFLRTNFARFLLGVRKPTQNTSVKNFSWIPLMRLNKNWTDEELFEHFNLLKSEKEYILDQVKKWTA